MFQCQVTGKVSQPGEAMNKIVVATRERIYTKKVRNEETGKWEDVEIGRGWEIVREIVACEEGLVEWNALSEDQQARLVKGL